MSNIRLLSVLVLSILFMVISFDYVIAERNTTYYVNAKSGLNIRKGPSVNFSIVKNLSCGSEVFVIKQIEEWSLISLVTKPSVDIGWASTKFLSTDNVDCNDKVVIIGKWRVTISEVSGYDHIITIKKINSKYFMEKHFEDGSSSQKRLIRYLAGGVYRFREVGNDFGEYYTISSTKSRRLNVSDSEGYITFYLNVDY